MGEIIALAIGVFGVAGVVFTALRYNRDDTTAILTQQSTIVGEMATLNTELRTTTDRIRSERDALQAQVAKLTVQVDLLREELTRALAR